MTDDEKLTAFAQDLKKVMAKHSARIEGCGCCGSAWLTLAGESFVDNAVFDERGVSYSIRKAGVTEEVTVG